MADAAKSRRKPSSSPPADSRPTSHGSRNTGATLRTTSSSAARSTTRDECWKSCSTGRESRSAIPREFHAVAVDARAPKFDGGIVTRLDSVPFGIVVNQRRRSASTTKGEDFWPKRYAIWGGLIARQPDQIAYSIIDAKAMAQLHAVGLPAGRGRLASPSWPRRWGSIRRHWRRRWMNSTARCGPAPSTRRSLDDCRTEGLDPPKSHWARADRHAAVLRLPAAAGHHVYLPRRRGGRAGAGASCRTSGLRRTCSPRAR